MENVQITDLNLNPILRELLKNHCDMVYEQDSITDDEHLIDEYYLLIRENRLQDLFECERTNNSFQS